MAKKNQEVKEDMFDDLGLFDDVMDIIPETEEIETERKTIEVDIDEDIVETPDLDAEETDGDADETEKPDGEDEADDGLEDGDDEAKPSLFTPYAKFLVEEGVLSTLDLDKFDGTPEGLKKAMSDEIGYYVNRYKESIPADVKRLIEGYEKGVPFDEMLKISSDRIRYDNITEEALASDTEVQKSIVRDYLDKTTKLTDSMKEKMISQWEDSLELEEQSKVALTELKSYQDQLEQEAIRNQEAEYAQIEKQRIESLSQLEKFVTDTSEIIPGIKINQIMKDKIKQNLTVPVAYDEYGNPVNKVGQFMRENPVQGEVILHYIFEATNGFKDWGVFGKVGKSQAIKELEYAQRAIDGKDKGNPDTRRKSSGSKNELYDVIGGILK